MFFTFCTFYRMSHKTSKSVVLELRDIANFFLQVCVKKCPDYYYYYDQDPNGYNKLICDYDVTDVAHNAGQYVSEGKCAKYYLKSSSCK